jgi:hypothetical protein
MTSYEVAFSDAAIFANTIALPDLRESVQIAVLEGVGKRPKCEGWAASIYERAESWVVVIEGPNRFRWEQEFFGPSEKNPNFIREMVSNAVCRGDP